LYQRIAVRARLDPLSPEATEAYIKHRLKLAGASHMLFTQEAVHAIHRASSGIPRLINTICDNSLFEGFLSRVNPITARVIEGVVTELGYDGVTERGGYRAGPHSPFAGYAGDPGTRVRGGRPTQPSGPVDRRSGVDAAESMPSNGTPRGRHEGYPAGIRAAVTTASVEDLHPSSGKSGKSAGSRPADRRVSSRGEQGAGSPSASERREEINSILAALEDK